MDSLWPCVLPGPVRVLWSECLAEENRGPLSWTPDPNTAGRHQSSPPRSDAGETRRGQVDRNPSDTFYHLFSLSGDILRLNTKIKKPSWRRRLKKQPLIIDTRAPAAERGQRGPRLHIQLLFSISQPQRIHLRVSWMRCLLHLHLCFDRPLWQYRSGRRTLLKHTCWILSKMLTLFCTLPLSEKKPQSKSWWWSRDLGGGRRQESGLFFFSFFFFKSDLRLETIRKIWLFQEA